MLFYERMILYRTTHLLGKFSRHFLSIENACHRNNTWRQFATRVQRNNKVPRYIAILVVGATSFYLFDKYRTSLGISKSELARSEELVNMDLNEIYEKTAVVFLSNSELREALGMPIKITTNNSISDTVRSIDLRREGSDLYAFIAYFLQGSQNSGVVYCKLKMEKSTEKFKTQSIILKLSKPDSKNRTEIVIKTLKKPDDDGTKN